MRYFLDFDRTIFDTPSFKRSLSVVPPLPQIARQLKEVMQEAFDPHRTGEKWRIFCDTIGTFVMTGHFIFDPDELKQYLYPDVPAFLREYGHQCTIVTYGVQALLMEKIASALADFSVDAIVYTDRRKGRTIRRLCEQHEGPFVFVDDMHFQLASVSRRCPDVTIFEIRRDTRKQPDGRWPVIHSLDELRKRAKGE